MKKKLFFKGMKDALPIGIAYFAVAFSLGIAMRNAGLTSIQGFFFSALNFASAGEYAAVQVIASQGTYLAAALATLIANARYLLMSTILSQKLSSQTPYYHRFLIAFGITDELFGINSAQKGYLEPYYQYGATTLAILCWAIGTSIGIYAGTALPEQIVNALGVALFGMFLAIIIPPTKKDKIVAFFIILSFFCSFIVQYIPYIQKLSSGSKTIILTLILSTIAAYFFPIKAKEGNQHE